MIAKHKQSKVNAAYKTKTHFNAHIQQLIVKVSNVHHIREISKKNLSLGCISFDFTFNFKGWWRVFLLSFI